MFHLNQLDRLVPGMCARLLVLGSDQAYALRALTPSWKKLSISILLVRRKSGDIVLLHPTSELDKYHYEEIPC